MASAIVKLVVEKLGNFAIQEAALLAGVGDQIVHLRDKFQWLQAFLKDAEQRRRDDRNELIGVWVNQIRDVAYDVEDVLDEFSLNFDLQSSRHISSWAWINCFVAWINCFGIANLLGRHHLAKQIESINVRLEEIDKNRSQLIQRDEAPSSSSPSLAPRYEMEEDTVGLDEDIKNLKEQLMDLDKPQHTVISIVGTGGLGKTTLANKIYKDIGIINHFGCRAWVSVSQTYRIKDLLKSILKSVVGLPRRNAEEMEESEMITKVCECLNDRTYLIVLDDVWDTAAWDRLKAAFPKKQTGSRVLLTTRQKNVGSYVHPDGHLYEMRFLSGEEIWQLFCNKTFRNSNYPDHLKPLKENIIQKCSGLPLATVVLGGLLRSKVHITDSYTEWEKVLKFISVAPGEVENQTRRILSLSYDELPHHLKSCFLYFSSFPEDFDIYVPRLIQMWVAEGFIIQHGNQELQMEDLAEGYMNQLIERCMIQLKERNVDGSIMFVRIHDLLLELARSEAKYANFGEVYDNLIHADLPQNPGIWRRFFLHRFGIDSSSKTNLNYSPFSKLRSLVLIPVPVPDPVPISYGKIFQFQFPKLLRVISLDGLKIESLPTEIGYLVHLRFLNLSYTSLERLPSTISNLCHLQTLNIKNTFITEVPDAFWRIQTLRHVYFPAPLFSVPKLFSNLNDLQTLDGVRSGEWMHEEGLEKLRNLRDLHIQLVSNSDVKALLNALPKLKNLSILRITNFISSRYSSFTTELPETQLAASEITQNDLVRFGARANLKHLSLFSYAYGGRILVFSTGGFSRLEKLILVRMHALEYLIVEGGAMPCLMSLTIAYCRKLKMLPNGLRHLSTLEVLKIVGMPWIKKRMEKNVGEDYPKIEHVPSVFYHEHLVLEDYPAWRPMSY